MFRIILLLFVFCCLPFFAFASNEERSLKDIQENIKNLSLEQSELQEKWKVFSQENGEIKSLLKPDLDINDTEELQSIIASYYIEKNNLEKAFASASKNNESTDLIKQDILRLKVDFYKSMTPFIKVESLQQYLKFIKENIEIVRDDKDLKEQIYKEKELFDRKVDSLKEKIEENRKILDERIRKIVATRIDEKIEIILTNPDYISLSQDSKISVFQKILVKIQERKNTLLLIKNKTTILEKKIEIFELFEEKVQNQINKLQK